ncbi:hypothetical protein BJ741DRAFT_318568 [Chytriomyces cf. hyalinus JEL632]|nr:hypothetical protein BJ741DRAFT_318568 [Chytriomyces cf. hyalinus JEL632]
MDAIHTNALFSSTAIHSRDSVLANSPSSFTVTPASSSPTSSQPQVRIKKRSQVKNACTTCKKACKKCDTQRPCPRCVRLGVDASCVDSVRARRSASLRGLYRAKSMERSFLGSSSPTAHPYFPSNTSFVRMHSVLGPSIESVLIPSTDSILQNRVSGVGTKTAEGLQILSELALCGHEDSRSNQEATPRQSPDRAVG